VTSASAPAYGPRYEEALSYAARLHATQLRKAGPGTPPTIPYVAHLLEVSSLVWIGGGTETEAIAGLLHDALEDQHEYTSSEEIARRFGTDVAHIVEHCTDGEPGAERSARSWLERKIPYLTRLWSARPPEMLVTCADKISNARAMVNDHAVVKEDLWNRFNAKPPQIAWYYDEVTQAVEHSRPGQPLTNQLRALTDELCALADGRDALYGVPDDERAAAEAALAELAEAKQTALARQAEAKAAATP
jgi:(p)ppGpp synthase/HD superfamily hydrolase